MFTPWLPQRAFDNGQAADGGGGRRLRPDKERREVPDGGCSGLYLIIQPSGVKSWAMRFRRPSGKSAKLTLGPVDLTNKEVQSEPVVGMPLTLASARSSPPSCTASARWARTWSRRGTAKS